MQSLEKSTNNCKNLTFPIVLVGAFDVIKLKIMNTGQI